MNNWTKLLSIFEQLKLSEGDVFQIIFQHFESIAFDGLENDLIKQQDAEEKLDYLLSEYY